MSETKEIQERNEGPAEKTKAIQVVQGSVQLQTIDDIWRLANMFCQSGLVPQGLDTPQKVVVVLEAGAEHGFKPWQSLQCFHVINGRLGMEGSAMLAKIRSSKICEYVKCLFVGTPYEDTYKAVVKSKRRNEPVEYETEFSVDDAKRAGLWSGKDNWKKYPKDMLTWRAVSRHARRYYSDEIHAKYTPDELLEFSPVPLDQTFEQAQLAASQTIAAEAGSEPIDTTFKADEPTVSEEDAIATKAKADAEKEKLAKAEKKANAKATREAKKKDKDALPKYHCPNCKPPRDFDEDVNVNDDGEMQCPKCLNWNVETPNEPIDPDIHEDNN